MNNHLKEEILTLIESPELRDYLMKAPEKLGDTRYAQIIAGVLNLLSYVDLSTHTLLVYPMAYDPTEKTVTEVDGPFPIRNLISAQHAIQNYNEENMQDNEFPHYWKIEVYDFSTDCKIFSKPLIICICNSEGEIQYIKTMTKNNIIVAHFGSDIPDLNLPVPYQPGDILEVDCRPYVPNIAYCLITEVGDDCCRVQCVFPCTKGKLDFGAFKHGRFFDEAYQMPVYMSPLYRSRVVHKALPEFYSVLEDVAFYAEHPEL